MPDDITPVPLFFSSPMTIARWNSTPEFDGEFGLHNPEWKILQSVPCATLLEGAIISSMNVSFFFFSFFPFTVSILFFAAVTSFPKAQYNCEVL